MSIKILSESKFGQPITNKWIEAALKKHFNKDQAILVGDMRTSFIGGKSGFMSQIMRVELTFADDDGVMPKSVVVKLPNGENAKDHFEQMDLDMEELHNKMSLEEQEKNFMNELFQMHEVEIHTMQILNANRNLKIPEIYGYQSGTFSQQPILMIEDYSQISAIQSMVEGHSLKQCHVLINELTKIQAQSLKWSADWKSFYMPIIESKLKGIEYFITAMKKITQRLAYLDPTLTDLVNRIITHYTIERITEPLKELERSGMPAIMTHGDLWTSNILWKMNEDGNAGDELATIVDWQSASPGAGISDLTRFLFSSVNGDLRRAHTESLLDYYYTSLEKHHGSQLPFTRQFLTIMYEKSMPFVMMFTVFGFPMWANIDSIVGEKSDPKRQDNIAELFNRARFIMEDYLAIHDK